MELKEGSIYCYSGFDTQYFTNGQHYKCVGPKKMINNLGKPMTVDVYSDTVPFKHVPPVSIQKGNYYRYSGKTNYHFTNGLHYLSSDDNTLINRHTKRQPINKKQSTDFKHVPRIALESGSSYQCIEGFPPFVSGIVFVPGRFYKCRFSGYISFDADQNSTSVYINSCDATKHFIKVAPIADENNDRQSEAHKKESAHRRNIQLIEAFTEMFKAIAKARRIKPYQSGITDAHGDILAKGAFNGAIIERMVKPLIPDEYIGRNIRGKSDRPFNLSQDERAALTNAAKASTIEKVNEIFSESLLADIKRKGAQETEFGKTYREHKEACAKLKETLQQIDEKHKQLRLTKNVSVLDTVNADFADDQKQNIDMAYVQSIIKPKRYVLLQDSPEAKAGSLVIWDDQEELYVLAGSKDEDGLICWQRATVESNPAWFKSYEEKVFTLSDIESLVKFAIENHSGYNALGYPFEDIILNWMQSAPKP